MKVKINHSIAMTLKTMREQAHIQAKDMACIIGKSPAYITKLEKGDIKTIDIKTLKTYQDMANNSDVTVEELLEKFSPIYKARVQQDFTNTTNLLIEQLGMVYDENADYLIKKLNIVNDNLKRDVGFTLAFVGQDLSSLNKLSYTAKENFLVELKELIAKYNDVNTTDLFVKL